MAMNKENKSETPYSQFKIAYIIIVTICIWSPKILHSQEIPNEFFKFQSNKILNDAGENGSTLSTFGPSRYKAPAQSSDSLWIESRFGIWSDQNATALYGFGHFRYKKHFYAYLYPRVVKNPSYFQRYSGIARDIERGGFSSGETDLSGIGFQNDWLIFQMGRGRQSWGSGESIQLALGEQSAPYDYTMLGLDFGQIRARYFHGFLETVNESINRYIAGRGVEWTNKRSLTIGLSEIAIYSGENRPIDVGYFNPISTHLEIELNDRLNALGTGSANAVWQCSIDWRPLENVRLSGNLLYDEFVLDKIQFDEGKENGMAYSVKAVYSLTNNESITSFYLSNIKVGTPTFRHGSGYNNFIQRQKPLGWIHGSDGQELKIGLNYFNRKNIIGMIEAGIRSSGEESITQRPYDQYEDYLAGPFPSGEFEDIQFISGRCQWWWKPQLSIFIEGEWLSITNGDIIKIGMDAFFQNHFVFN